MADTVTRWRVDYRNFMDGRIHVLLDDLSEEEADNLYNWAIREGMQPVLPIKYYAE